MFCVHYINTLQIHSDNMVAKLKSIIAYWIKQNDLFSSQGKDTDIAFYIIKSEQLISRFETNAGKPRS